SCAPRNGAGRRAWARRPRSVCSGEGQPPLLRSAGNGRQARLVRTPSAALPAPAATAAARTARRVGRRLSRSIGGIPAQSLGLLSERSLKADQSRRRTTNLPVDESPDRRG